MPMHFFSMLQMLTSFLENMGAGRHILRYKGRNIIADANTRPLLVDQMKISFAQITY